MLECKNIQNVDKCIVGDFNFPSIKWDDRWEGEDNDKFVECIRDSFLTQKVKNPTRHRKRETPNLLDLVQ